MLSLILSIGTVLSVVAILSLTSPALGDCTRDVLIAAADAYVAAQGNGTLGDLQKLLTADYKYQENNKASTVAVRVISTALKIANGRATADTLACASYTELVATTPKLYVVGIHLRHTADGTAITLIDVIAATTGSLPFNAAKTLGYIQKEIWSTIDPSKYDSRDLLQQTEDAYLDMWTNASAYNAVPWGAPCERVEGSSLSPPCTVGAPEGGSTSQINMRRYVIDQSQGSAEVQCDFAAVGGVAGSREFRLENGKLRYV
jgi:hypothetical protein